MVRNGLMCYLFFILLLECSSQFPELNSINVLRGIQFGNRFPRHGLPLLHWFATNINFNNNDIIPLNFEPNRGDYGIHFYGNYEGLLDVLPSRYRVVHGRNHLTEEHSYYTVGNLRPNNNQNNALALPSYVTRGFYNPGGYPDNNRDRIIIRVRQEHNSRTDRTRRTIDQVYITQHPRQQPTYDPLETYRVSTQLLREIQGLSQINVATITSNQIRQRYHSQVNQTSLSQLQPFWGNLCTLGLLLLMVLNSRAVWRYRSSILCFPVSGAGAAAVSRRKREGEEEEDDDDEDVLQIELDVRTAGEGKARICWKGVPARYLNHAKVMLFRSHEDHVLLSCCLIRDRSSGSYDTKEPLHPGLQVCLHLADPCQGAESDEEILRGPEFHDANRVLPVYLKDQDGASLQLFVHEGRACIRLYVRNTFLDWRSKLQRALVGIYPSSTTPTPVQSQVLESLQLEARTDADDIPDYRVYVFYSAWPMSPGVQARLMSPDSRDLMASTPPWEGYVPPPPPGIGASAWGHDEM